MIESIEEKELRVLLSTGSVRHFELRQRERGFDVYLSFDRQGKPVPQRAMLVTQRAKNLADKKPRSWASLDNFIKYLRGMSEVPPEVRIQLN